MVAYQREAVELAFLHHRYLRGTAPAGFEQLGQEHVNAMRALRNLLVWPGAAGRNTPQPATAYGATPGIQPGIHGSGGNR
jgi:hypothetical protein